MNRTSGSGTLWRRGILPVCCLALMLCGPGATPVLAEGLYRWVDAQGLVHFSDVPPPPGAARPQQLPEPAFSPPRRSPEEDPYSILNQAQRLEEQRRQLTLERLQRRRLEQEAQERRLRELEAGRRAREVQSPGVVYAYPRPLPPRVPAHRPRQRPGRADPPGLWRPDHPAYRPRPPARPRPRPMAREGFD